MAIALVRRGDISYRAFTKWVLGGGGVLKRYYGMYVPNTEAEVPSHIAW